MGAQTREYPKPRIVASRCLGFDACRYDGGKIASPFLERLAPFVHLIPVCPEVEIGLGTPRDPIVLYRRAGGERGLFQPRTKRDLTSEMNAFSARYLAGLGEVDGFILKARSPSCGISDAKIFPAAGSDTPLGRGAGLFAHHVIKKFGALGIADERQLEDPAARDPFLTKIFTLAAFREVKEEIRRTGRLAPLARYHEENAPLLAAHHPECAGEMERLASGGDLPFGDGEIPAAYEKALLRLLARLSARAPSGRQPPIFPYPPSLGEV